MTASVVTFWEIPGIDHLVVFTDTGVNIKPDLKAKGGNHQKRRLCLSSPRIPGNISDVSTLRNLVLTFKALEVKRLHYVMDKG